MKKQTLKYEALLSQPDIDTKIEGGKLICDNVEILIPLTASLYKINKNYILKINESEYFTFKFKKLKDLLIKSDVIVKYTNKVSTSKQKAKQK